MGKMDKNMKGIGQPWSATVDKIEKGAILTAKQTASNATDQAQTNAK